MIKIMNLYKTYQSNNLVSFRALEGINLSFEEKGLVFILGKSGSGKSTLINMIGALDKFDKGEIVIENTPLSTLNDVELSQYRNTFLGFVFQHFNLFNDMSVFDNIRLALEINATTNDLSIIDKLLEEFNLLEQKDKLVKNLSGGQKQRISIIRAIIKNPKLILADEPTGSLDEATSSEIFDILRNQSKQRLVIVVSHNRELANKYADRIIEIKDGTVFKDLVNHKENKMEINKSVIVGNSFVKVNSVDKISNDLFNDINDKITSAFEDTYIYKTTDEMEVKAFYPHLRETFNSQLDSEVFEQYVAPSNSNLTNLKLDKSHLKFFDSFKLGINNIYKKLFRTILIILILSVSFSLSMIASDISYFTINRQIVNSIEKYDYDYIHLDNDSTGIDSARLTELDDLGVNYLYNYKYNIYFESNIVESITNYTVVNDDTNLNFIDDSGRIPQTANEIVITESLAYILAKEQDIDIVDLNNSTIEDSYGPNIYTICGIIKDEFDIVTNYDSIVLSGLYGDTLYKVTSIYVCDEFQNQIEKTPYVNVELNLIFSIYVVNESTQNLIVDLYPDEEMQQGDVYVSQDIYDTYIDNIDLLKIDVLNNDYNPILVDEFRVHGIVSKSDYNSIIAFSDETYDLLIDNYYNIPTSILIESSSLYTNTLEKLEAIDNLNLTINTSFYEFYEDMYYYGFEVLVSVIKGISYLIAFISFILLFAFLKGNIKDDTKKIGLLRSLGARRLDIYLIYIYEAITLLVGSLVVSIIFYGMATPIANAQVSNVVGSNVSVLIFDIKAIASTIILAIVIGGLSVILPIRRINKMSCVDAMKE